MKAIIIIFSIRRIMKSIIYPGIPSWIFFALSFYLLFLFQGYTNAQQTYTWTGAVSQAFNVSGNWSPEGIPGQNDTIVLNSGNIEISTGNPVSLGGIHMTGGTIIATDSVTFSGEMFWDGGTLQGSGSLTCSSNALLVARGIATKYLNQIRLVNNGTISWEGSGSIALSNGINLNNYGLFEIKNNSSMWRGIGSGNYFRNFSSGVIRKYSDGLTTFGEYFDIINEGLFEVLDGSLEIQSNGTFSGILDVKNGSPLILSKGQITWTTSSVLKASGEVLISGYYYVFGGIYNASEKTTLNWGTSDFTGEVVNLGDTLNISIGYINFLSGDISIPVIQLSSGSLAGTAAIQVTQAFNWSGGTIAGPGSLNISENAVLNLTGAPKKYFNNRIINNLGTIFWEGSGDLSLNGSTEIRNQGLFEIKNNSNMDHGTGSTSHFINFNGGIIRKSSEGKTTLGHFYFDNQGSIDLQKDTLILKTTATYTGDIHSAKNTLISIEESTHDFNPGVNLDLQGSLLIKGGVTKFNTDFNFPPNTSIIGGEIGASGILTVSDTMSWYGGTLSDTGYINIDVGGVMIITGTSSKLLDKRKILNSGQIFASGGGLIVANYSIIKNQGKFIINGPYHIYKGGPGGRTPEFDNLGDGYFQINNTSGGTVTIEGSDFINSGNLEINSGIFEVKEISYVGGHFIQMGGISNLNFAEFNSSQEMHINNGMVKGNGRIDADLYNNGLISPGVDEQSPGSLTISGQYKQDTSGVIQIDIAGRSPVTGYDQLTTGKAILSGELDIRYIGNFKPSPEDKFRVVRWVNQSFQGTFDTITNLQYLSGQTLDPKYSITNLTLYGNMAHKDIWVQVIGPDIIRPGMSIAVKILYGNETTDTIVFPMLLELGQIDDLLQIFDYVHFPKWIPWEDPEAVQAFPESVKDIFITDNNVSIPFLVTIPGRNPGEEIQGFNQLDMSLKPKCTRTSRVRVSVGDPLEPDIEGCLWGIAEELVGFLPGGECVKAGVKIALRGMEEYTEDKPLTLGGWISSNGWEIAKCAISFVPGMKLVTKTAEILDAVVSGVGTAQTAGKCAAALLPQEGGQSAQLTIQCIMSHDPNMKAGPDGNNALNYIRGNHQLAYAIYFENVDTATAPAQKVIIKDTLNPDHWDFSTFSFTSISFGDTTIYPPAWVHDFYKEVDLRPQKNLIVGITGNMDDKTGIITWEFISLDPVTHNPTTDPLAGFLPPDVLPPEGEGNVIYIVQPNLDLPSGTGIGSHATVYFDNNEPMTTNTWKNHLDRTPPTSCMGNISEIQVSSQFELNWSGSDNHSGIKKYFLYVSENNGPFMEWLVTSDTSCIFEGDTCSQYQFYVLALDSAGNKEPEKSPEIQVLVNPFVQPMLEASGITEFCEGDSVLLRAEAGDSLVYDWYRDNQLITDAHDSVYYAKLQGDYTVMTGLSEVCSGLSDPITVIVNMLPDAVISATGNLLVTISGEASYQWYFNSNPIAGATNSSYLAEISGDYQVEITGVNGCSGMSEIYHHLAITVEDHSFGHFMVFPNPAHDKIYIQFANEWTEGLIMRIIDLKGSIMMTCNMENLINNQIFEIDLNRLKQGDYYLQVIHDNDTRYYLFSRQ